MGGCDKSKWSRLKRVGVEADHIAITKVEKSETRTIPLNKKRFDNTVMGFMFRGGITQMSQVRKGRRT